MSSILNGLEIARRGLYVSQQGMTLTGNNISNASTQGYTRQRMVVDSLYPNTHSRYANGVTIGNGAEVTSIDQIRSDFIDRQLRQEYSSFGEWNTRSEELVFIESVINETSDYGTLSTVLCDFYDSLSQLTNESDSIEIRTNLQQNAIKLCETLGYYHEQLVDLQCSYNEAMSVTVDTINNHLKGIASYNEQILSYELGGQHANELRDSRNMLLDSLSQLVNIRYSEDADGRLSVSVDGTTMVDHTTTTLLEVSADQTGVVSDEPGFYSIYYEGTTTDFAYSSGELQAYKDLRDGNTVDNIGVPYLISSLDTFAQSMAQEFNAVHQTGYTIPYGAGTSQTNVDFFDVPAGGYSDITAGNISLSAEVFDNVYNIAASGAFVDLTAADTQEGNNEVALKLFEISTSSSLGTVGNFEDYVQSFVVQLGISSAAAQETSSSQTTIVDNLETRRESISGVSVDEEVINLISYQHAYSAASRVLTAMDEALNVLINSTGRVGL